MTRNKQPHERDTPQMPPHVCLSENRCGSRLPQLPQYFLLNALDANATVAHHRHPALSVFISIY